MSASIDAFWAYIRLYMWKNWCKLLPQQWNLNSTTRGQHDWHSRAFASFATFWHVSVVFFRSDLKIILGSSSLGTFFLWLGLIRWIWSEWFFFEVGAIEAGILLQFFGCNWGGWCSARLEQSDWSGWFRAATSSSHLSWCINMYETWKSKATPAMSPPQRNQA